MLMPTPLRGRSSWLRPLALVLALLAIATAVYLATRRGRGPGPVKGAGTAQPARLNRSGYENRALWSRPSNDSERRQQARITGTAYDMNGRVLSGVRVSATTFEVAGNQSTTVGVAESDGRGRFEVPLAAGTYYLNGAKEGYTPVVMSAHTGEDIGLILQKSGAVTGHVYNEKKEPVTRFTIDIISATTDDMAAPGPHASRQFDSPDGSYRMDGVPEMGAFVRVTAPRYSPAVSEMLGVAPGETRTVDLVLSAGCTMTGTVVDEDGLPLSDVFIDAELRRSAGMIGTSSVDATSQAESDSDGRFTLQHVAIGDVLVRAYDGSHAVATAEVKVESCSAVSPVSLRMTGGASLTGVVRTADGKPVAGARLSLTNRAVGFASAVSDAEGRYHFDRLPAGVMRVQAIRGAQRAVGLVTVPETGSTERDLPFPEEGTGEIRGRVTANGAPLGGIQLMIVSYKGTNSVMDTVYPSTTADGSYRATGLGEGTYAIIVSSTSRITSARVEPGGVQTVDIDVAVKPQQAPMPAARRKGEEMSGGDE
jgi:hypothetical protein